MYSCLLGSVEVVQGKWVLGRLECLPELIPTSKEASEVQDSVKGAKLFLQSPSAPVAAFAGVEPAVEPGVELGVELLNELWARFLIRNY